jgi:hypothetical protein
MSAMNISRLESALVANSGSEILSAVFALLSDKPVAFDFYFRAAELLFLAEQNALAVCLCKKAILQEPLSERSSNLVNVFTGKIPAIDLNELISFSEATRANFGKIFNLIDQAGDFVFLDLGSSAIDHFAVPAWVKDRIYTISLDGLDIPEGSGFGKRASIKKIVAGGEFDTVFNEKYHLAGSSLLQDDQFVVRSFGMEKFAEVKNKHNVKTVTLAEVLKELEIKRIDALKTDLEGIDFDVIKSIEPMLYDISFLRAELAFFPRYIGEPRFSECDRYLSQKNYMLMGMTPETWRFKTEHRDYCPDGRLVWGDFEYINDKNVVNYDLACVARHALVASFSGYSNYAEFLIESQISVIDSDLSKSLKFVLFSESVLLNPKYINATNPHLA